MAGVLGARPRCKYFMKGKCNAGNLCRFSHSTSDSPNAPVQQRICRFFSTNSCFFGENCRNLHVVAGTAAGVNLGNNPPVLRNTRSRAANPRLCPVGEFGAVSGGGGGAQESDAAASASGMASNNMMQELLPESRKVCNSWGNGPCRVPNCARMHGTLCGLCSRFRMHPTDQVLQEAHIRTCRRIRERRADAELGQARSVGKACGICLDTVIEKTSGDQRFGILPNCRHCFCLACLRQWRHSEQFNPDITRRCPQCRVPSDYVCPSSYWVESQEQKERLISNYKAALEMKDCKYFRSGRGKCPFGNKCFYRHAYPDGTKADVGPPRSRCSPGDVLEPQVVWMQPFQENGLQRFNFEMVSMREYCRRLTNMGRSYP